MIRIKKKCRHDWEIIEEIDSYDLDTLLPITYQKAVCLLCHKTVDSISPWRSEKKKARERKARRQANARSIFKRKMGYL